MSQFVSRIHIKVSSPDVWKRFENEDDAGFYLAEYANSDKLSFILDQDWACTETELFPIVEALAQTLGKDGIIIADTTNINVDPYDHCCYYLGDLIQESIFEDYNIEDEENEGADRCTMFDDTSIEDIPGWLKYGRFSISNKEKDQLFRCGYVETGDGFKEYSANFSIPNRVYLRETCFEGRAERIERLKIGDPVTLNPSWDKYDPNRLEVFSALGSIGYLPSDISDQLTPLLSTDNLVCSGTVIEIRPLSQRNKLARSPFVAISVETSLQRKGAAKPLTADKKDGNMPSSRTASVLSVSSTLSGKTFVVTGDLFNYSSRDELKEIIERNGGKLTGSVSSKTTALITNFPDSGTTKIKKAFECGIEIISEDEFIERYMSAQQPALQEKTNSIKKTLVVKQRNSMTRIHVIVAEDADVSKLDWIEIEHLLKKASHDPDAVAVVIAHIVSLLSDDCFVIADYISMLSDDFGLSAGWMYNRKCLFDDYPMGGNDNGVYPTDIDIEDVNTWVNEFIRQRLFVGTAEEYFCPLLDAPYLRGIFTEADLLNYQTFMESQETFEIVDDSVSENDVEQVEEATVSVDEERQLAVNALQEEAECKRQEETAAQARALEMVRKAAEEEKLRREAEERKRLEEEELKRKEAEEQKRRKEEDCKQKEAETRRIAEEKAKAEAEARRIAEEKYHADLKVWEQTCEDIQKQREQAVTDRIAAEKAALEQAAQKDYDAAVSAAANRKKTAQQNKADAELRLGKLGLFKFAEKNAMKEAIAQAETEIADAEKELEQAKQDLNTTLATIPEKVSAQESAIRKSVEEELALPSKPVKANQ